VQEEGGACLMREIDLRPDWYVESLSERRGSGFRLGGLIAMGALIVIWGYDATSRTNAAATELAELAHQVKAQDAAAADIAVYEAEMVARQRYAGLLKQVGGGVGVVEVIAEVTRAMPRAMNIERFQLDKAPRIAAAVEEENGGGEAKDARPALSNVQFYGFAATGGDVGGFVSRLSQSPLFEDVTLRFQRTILQEGEDVVEFYVECSMPLFE